MNHKERMILAEMQINNLLTLTEDLQYTAFIKSHLLPVKYELQRQLSLLTNTKEGTKIKNENNWL